MTDKSKFDELTSDVDWQLKSLLSYIRKSFKASPTKRAKMSSSDLVVQDVLDAYLMLVDKFYEQFKSQLRKAHNRKVSKNVAKENVADAEVMVLVQQALDKITAEWERVYGFIAATAAKKTPETEQIITKLSPLIRAAISDVGFSPESFPVIPQFGTAYSLGFFNYTDDFLALNLPITALQSPWEWTIFWHEIAGLKLRLLKKTYLQFLSVLSEMFGEMRRWQQQNLMKQEDLTRTIKANLDLVLSLTVPFTQLNTLVGEQKDDYLDTLTDCVAKDWESFESLSTPFVETKKFIHALSSSQHDFPIFMFSFDYLLEEVMEKIRSQQQTSVMNNLRNAHQHSLKINKISATETDNVMENLFKAWEKALTLEDSLATQKKALADEGWSADWLEELFEDSFSTLNFDVNFLPVFDKLLHRRSDGGKDMRHPPHYVRLAAAAALKLLECDETLVEQDLPPAINEFPSGLNGDEKKILGQYYPGLLSDNAQAVVWLVAKKFHEMHKRMRIPYDDPGGTIQQSKATIANAMKTHIGNNNTTEEIAKIANNVLTSIAGAVSASNPLLDEKNIMQNKAKYNLARDNYTKKINTLLSTRNVIPPQLPLGYRELLDLSFYEVDFGIETYWDVQSPWGNFASAQLLGPPIPVENGPVLYKTSSNSDKPLRTNKKNWNDKARDAYKLLPL